MIGWFTRQESRFKKHDTVQLIGGGYLMVVTRVNVSDKNAGVSVECQWYDRVAKEVKTGIYREGELKLFDWYHPD